MDNLKNWKTLNDEDKGKVCKALKSEVKAGIKVAAIDTVNGARALLTPFAIIIDCFIIPV